MVLNYSQDLLNRKEELKVTFESLCAVFWKFLRSSFAEWTPDKCAFARANITAKVSDNLTTFYHNIPRARRGKQVGNKFETWSTWCIRVRGNDALFTLLLYSLRDQSVVHLTSRCLLLFSSTHVLFWFCFLFFSVLYPLSQQTYFSDFVKKVTAFCLKPNNFYMLLGDWKR